MSNSANKRLLFVIGSLRVGGAETQMVLLIEKLVERGIKCEVFVMRAEGALLAKLKDIGVDVHDGKYQANKNSFLRAWQIGRVFLRLIWLIIKRRYDVLHAFLPMTNLLGSIAGRIARVPLIITSRRALGTHQDRSNLWPFFDKVANACSDIVTVNSKAVWRDTVARDGIDETKLRLIYNGLDTKPFVRANKAPKPMRQALNLEKDCIAIVMVANLILYKGHFDVVQALPSIVSTYPAVKVLFVGDDRGIEESLKELAEELGVAQHVVFLGRCANVPKVLSAADIGLISSHEEGFCNALLEMMAMSLPIVATDVGGNAEALKQGKYGVLIPPKSPPDIGNGILSVLDDWDSAVIKGEKAFDYVCETYTVENMIEAYMKIYMRNSNTIT